MKDAEPRLRHKLFPPNAWMLVTDFDVLTSCPKDELHQWFIGLYGEHIIPAIVHRYMLSLLMLSLPLAVRDLIAPEVLYISCIFYVYKTYIPVLFLLHYYHMPRLYYSYARFWN